MPIRISIPRVNMWDVGGGVQKILAATSKYTNSRESLVFDLTDCSFLSAEATALLASIIVGRQKKGLETQLHLADVPRGVLRTLSRMGLLELCEASARFVPRGSSLPLLITEHLDRERILQYIDNEVMSRPQMPTMTERLQRSIRQAFFEVIGNVFYHSTSPVGALVCGQIYPKAKEIQVTFLDRGIGVAAKICSCNDGIRNEAEAIEWALQRGTSTLSTGAQSRGLGLYLLRDFIRANEGQFRIYANGAYLEETPGTRNCGYMEPPLKGTLIDLRINIRPDVSYGFMEELADQDSSSR